MQKTTGWRIWNLLLFQFTITRILTPENDFKLTMLIRWPNSNPLRPGSAKTLQLTTSGIRSSTWATMNWRNNYRVKKESKSSIITSGEFNSYGIKQKTMLFIVAFPSSGAAIISQRHLRFNVIGTSSLRVTRRLINWNKQISIGFLVAIHGEQAWYMAYLLGVIRRQILIRHSLT